jgi:hypothetical protein
MKKNYVNLVEESDGITMGLVSDAKTLKIK